LFFILTGNALADQFKVQEENLLLEQIEKDPRSEERYYNYAFFLFGEDRYKDAMLQLNKVLKLNPGHKKAKSLLKGLNALKSIQDPGQRKIKKADIAMGFFKDLSLDLSVAMNQLKNFDSPENTNKINQRLKELDKKYQISSYRGVDPFSKEKFA